MPNDLHPKRPKRHIRTTVNLLTRQVKETLP